MDGTIEPDHGWHSLWIPGTMGPYSTSIQKADGKRLNPLCIIVSDGWTIQLSATDSYSTSGPIGVACRVGPGQGPIRPEEAQKFFEDHYKIKFHNGVLKLKTSAKLHLR